MQRLVDEGQHTFQIAIDLIVPETQYPEALADKMIVALRVTSGMSIAPTRPPSAATLPLRGRDCGLSANRAQSGRNNKGQTVIITVQRH
jgi:hypothetical protein